MKKILFLFGLLIIGAFLLGCAPQSAEDKLAAGDLTSAEKAQLPSDLKEEGIALAGKAVDFSSCTDPDSTSIFDKNSLLTKSTTTYAGGSKEDKCYTWNKGTPQEKTRLIEGTCKNKKFIYWYATCSDYLGKDYGCEEGKCIGNYGDGIYVLKEGDKVTSNSGVKVEIVNITNGFLSYMLNLNFYLGEDKINPIPVPILTIFKLPGSQMLSNIDYVDYAIKIGANGDDFFAEGVHYVNLTITSVETDKISTPIDLYNLCIKKYGKSKYACMKYSPYEPGEDEIKLQDGKYLILASPPQEDNAKNLLPEMGECSQVVSQEIGIEPIFELTPLRIDENATMGVSVTNNNGIYWSIKSSVKYNFSLNECENQVLLHELTHYAIAPAPLNDIFNEGFAVYVVENYKPENDPMGILCLEGGWTTNNKHPLNATKEKYVNPDGTGKYMDLTKYLKQGYPYKESWIYFYNTAYCFWDGIEKKYGLEVFSTIVDKIEEYRNSGEKLCLDKELKNLIGEEEYLKLVLKFYPSDIPIDDGSGGIPSPSITCKKYQPIIMTGDQWT